MRIWSLHPKYLDRAGLVALWREALLAQDVLAGKTQGYRHHPQLVRFRNHPDPQGAIAAYLKVVHREATERGYRFDAAKIPPHGPVPPIPVSHGQLLYERGHLLRKLLVRDPAARRTLEAAGSPEFHPLFTIRPGDVEGWEKIRVKAAEKMNAKKVGPSP